jgi:hypothetical protein
VHFDLYGLSVETPRVTFFLRSPWRASALEHRLFDAIRLLCKTEPEQEPDELRLQITEQKISRQALQAVARILMGWQEDADPGSEKRSWRWMIEGDTDASGYDHTGEVFGLWGFLRLSMERGGPGEPEKGEDIDMEGFGLQLHANRGSN